MSRRKSTPQPNRGKAFFAIAVLAVGIVLGAAWWFGRTPRTIAQSEHKPAAPVSETTIFASYGKSPSCKSCHEEAYANWAKSHHALAERAITVTEDGGAFEPGRDISHGAQTSRVARTNDSMQLITAGGEGQRQAFSLERVIGVSPLRQFLTPGPGGRWQATELAFDPHQQEWFNVFGSEDRKPGEWGHWTGRGMNWNNMCANCHNTRLRKNYDEATDTYRTAMAERGVGCEACHGPMADHTAWQAKHPNQSGDPTIRKIGRQEMFSACGQCHARRAELTDDFKPGDNFFDHHQLTIPDETDIFYPDGQVHDENYEYTAFLGSKMHAAGVRCIDCHEPHSNKLRVAGNLMCMSCHGSAPATTPGVAAAPRIDEATHSRHTLGTSGAACVSCHMPLTTYMQRHQRHDHGFTIPDPRLTKELGIPNACNRCHTDQTADWALEAMNRWYGPRTNDQVRVRATAISKARAGDATALGALANLIRSETNFFWRATVANLLKLWPGDTNATMLLVNSARDTNELVRGMVARGLEPSVQLGATPAVQTLTALLSDPVRAVRVEAAWALRASLDTNSRAGTDLLAHLRHNADQPAGAMQLGVFHLDRGDMSAAMNYFRRALSWDTNSAPLYHAWAIALSMNGQTVEAVAALRAACRIAPRFAEYRYKLGLALNEMGALAEARQELEETVKLDPRYSRAWYNLGLAYAAAEMLDLAVNALTRAESLDADSAEIPYAKATVLARAGRTGEARVAARRALELRPTFREATELLQVLGR